MVTQHGAEPASGPPSGKVSTDIVDEIRQISGVEEVAGMRLEHWGEYDEQLLHFGQFSMYSILV